jgi:hypothetical protein
MLVTPAGTTQVCDPTANILNVPAPALLLIALIVSPLILIPFPAMKELLTFPAF